jgi:hypothetical protein
MMGKCYILSLLILLNIVLGQDTSTENLCELKAFNKLTFDIPYDNNGIR